MEPLALVRPRGCDFELEAPARHRSWYEVTGYEAQSSDLFRVVAQRADVILDIGAHVGFYSLLGASSAPEAVVVAVEASPDNAAVLTRNVERAGRSVRVVAAAFADRPGTARVQLTDASDNSGLSGHPHSETVETVEVPAVSAAELDLPEGRKIVVKLDVEGHEVAALEGLEPVFSAYEDVRLLVELNPKCLDRAGSGPAQLLARLDELGLRCFLVDEERRWLVEASTGRIDALRESGGYANLYCVRKDRCVSVAAVLHSSGTGGTERSHAELTSLLVRDGLVVQTFAPGPDAGLMEALRTSGGTVRTLGELPWWMRADAGTPWALESLVPSELVAELEEARPDVVLTQSGVSPAGALAAAALGLPHVWYLREYGDKDYALVHPGGVDGFRRLVDMLSDGVATNSDGVARHLLGDRASSAVVLSPAPRLDVVDPPHRPASRPWTFGVIGSLNPGKGQDLAIEALRRLVDQDADVRLAVVGPASPQERSRVEGLVERAGVASRVDLVDATSDRGEIYGMLDCVAVTSRCEAFGRVPFEATAMGLPVVYADAGGPAEYLDDGSTGLAFRSGDADSLARALLRLRDDEALGRDLVASARRSLLSQDRQDGLATGAAALLRDAARMGAAPDPVRQLLGAAVRGARRADDAGASLRHVVQEHGELVERFHALEQEHANLVTGHLGFVEQHERHMAACDSSQESLSRALSDLAQAQEDLTVSSENNRRLREAVGDLQEQLSAARADLYSERLRSAAAEGQVASLEGSRTWRARGRLARLLRRP